MDDFLIIGGGIAGLSAGARLATLGRVVVLEGEEALGHHASGRSAALFEPNYGQPPVVALSQASADFFHSGGQAGEPGLLSPRGLLIVSDAARRDVFAADVQALGLGRISPDEACAMIPVLRRDRVQLAAHHDRAWDIDTDRMMQDFARAIRTAGGQVITRARVGAITRDGGHWRVSAGGQEHTARNIVNAAGAWADQVAQMAGVAPIGLQPYRRSMARVAAPAGHDIRNWPMLFGPGEAFYAKPDAGALLISPADETPVEPHDAWADDMTLAEGIAAYEEWVTTPVTRMIANWAGLRSFAPDRNLVIGADADVEGFWWNAGQGGYGFQTAPAASALLADLVAGRQPALEPEVVAALSPARFA